MGTMAEKENHEQEKMNSGNDQEGKDTTGPGGSTPAARHSDPNGPLSKPPRYFGSPKLKPFNGKKWFHSEKT